METLLAMLKIDLGLTVDAYDSRLQEYLTSSIVELKKMGAQALDETAPEDAELIVLYAQWKWKHRDNLTGIPEGLRFKIHNRVFGEKMQTEAAT